MILCEPSPLWRVNIIWVARLERVSEGYEPQVSRLAWAKWSLWDHGHWWTEQITRQVTLAQGTRRGFGRLLLTSTDGVKLFIKEMVACAFISPFQSYHLILFIRLSLHFAGFDVERRPHTQTCTETTAPTALTAVWHCYSTYSQALYTPLRKTRVRALIKAPVTRALLSNSPSAALCVEVAEGTQERMDDRNIR